MISNSSFSIALRERFRSIRPLRAICTGLVIGLTLGAFACANSSIVVLTNFKKEHVPIHPDSVRITTEVLPTPPYLEIGYVYVAERNLESTLSISRQRAAQIGADVIMDARAGIAITQIGSILTFPVYDRAYFLRGIAARRRVRQ